METPFPHRDICWLLDNRIRGTDSLKPPRFDCDRGLGYRGLWSCRREAGPLWRPSGSGSRDRTPRRSRPPPAASPAPCFESSLDKISFLHKVRTEFASVFDDFKTNWTELEVLEDPNDQNVKHIR
jgi:hypothetical protein